VSCDPVERVWWSPDGKTSVVHGASALHLAEPGGSLGAPLDLGGKPDAAIPGGVDWLPDSSGFVFARVRPVADWKEAQTLIPEEETKAVEGLARILPGAADAAIRASEEKTLDAAFSAIPLKMSPCIEPAVGLAWEKDSAGITTMLKTLSDGQPILDALAGPEGKIKVREICRQKVGNGQASGVPEVLATSVLAHGALQVSPDGKWVACFREGIEDDTRELLVLSLAGGQVTSITSGKKLAFAWAPDSTALVIVRPVGGDGPLSDIDRQTVVDAQGKLLAAKELLPLVPLARAVMNAPTISVLPDGRVFFAGTPVQLPAAGAATRDTKPKLFLVAADGSGVTEIPCAPGSLPMDLRNLVLSPDGKKAAIVESGSSVVAVVDLATGVVQMIEPPVEGWENRTLPAWRGNNEFTFTAVRDGKARTVRWSSQSGVETWGQNWPEGMISHWMSKREAKGE
jgi:hypothetical protein